MLPRIALTALLVTVPAGSASAQEAEAARAAQAQRDLEDRARHPGVRIDGCASLDPRICDGTDDGRAPGGAASDAEGRRQRAMRARAEAEAARQEAERRAQGR